jgi:hypothetical protein
MELADHSLKNKNEFMERADHSLSLSLARARSLSVSALLCESARVCWCARVLRIIIDISFLKEITQTKIKKRGTYRRLVSDFLPVCHGLVLNALNHALLNLFVGQQLHNACAV